MSRSTTHPEVTTESLLAELDRVQAELADLREELDRTAHLASLGTWLGCIAHEFNNIMTPVRGYASAALRHPESTALVDKALRHAESGADRAATMARTILELTADPRFSAESFGTSSCDPGEVFQTVLELVGLSEQHPGIESEIQIDPHGLRVAIESAVLHQVLLNLVLNSIQAVGERGRLTLRVRRSTGNTAEVCLEDTGCGMSPEQAARAFEPFVTERRKSHGPAGTGLGLTLSRRLLERAGGSIELRSEQGAGTACILRIPIAA